MSKRNIPFSPPDIGEEEINEVVDTLKSGWITTGPKTKQFEREIADYCGSEKAVCLNSATAGLELILRLFDIGPGDEVILPVYTYSATANVIVHTGATPVFVDIREDNFTIDAAKIAEAVTERTKAVMPVDFAGWPCDYDEIKAAMESKKTLYKPAKGSYQELLDRPLLLADSAHSFGAAYKGKMIGSVADFTVFSFHAVKNLTTAEGGAITFDSFEGLTSDEIYSKLMLLSLHGQSKDALSKMKAGSWRYTIECAGYKCNMTDIQSAIGLVQLKRYEGMLEKRERLFELYNKELAGAPFINPPFSEESYKNSFHLYPLRLEGFSEEQRDKVIAKMADKGIATNVHFIPLTLQPFYQGLGYKMDDYPNTYNMYKNEITLPLYSKMEEDDVIYICRALKEIVGG